MLHVTRTLGALAYLFTMGAGQALGQAGTDGE
jgi:hypothetical protein